MKEVQNASRFATRKLRPIQNAVAPSHSGESLLDLRYACWLGGILESVAVSSSATDHIKFGSLPCYMGNRDLLAFAAACIHAGRRQIEQVAFCAWRSHLRSENLKKERN